MSNYKFVELYKEVLPTLDNDRPSFNDLLFLTAFPKVDLKKKVRELTRLSEDIFEPFYEKWAVRLENDIKEKLKVDMDIQIIVNTVSPYTRAELTELMELMDQYIPAVNEAEFAIKVSEWMNHIKDMTGTATKMLQALYGQHEAEKQSKKIITSQGIVGLDGEPLKTGL